MSNRFRVNQKVVYPSQGVGKILEVFEKEFKGENVPYYKIYIEASDMVVMVPVANAPNLGIRQIVGADEAKEALNLLSEEGEAPTSDWKLRYQQNLELLKKGTVKDIATIVRTLYTRSKVKELPILERKLYDSAKKLLIDEISIALGMSEKEVENQIHLKLEPEGKAQKEKHVIQIDEDEDDDLMGDVKSDSKRSSDSDDDGDFDEDEDYDDSDE
ncbi:MAG: CarD family transcriptional regulator [Treponema sp.]|nr:CarD family transcriptional regulator [Treponema sp.]